MLLDVSELYNDADVGGEGFVVIRREQLVSDHGKVTTQDQRITNLIGSVYPTGDNSLSRQEAFDAQAKSITVVTNFRLRGVSKQGEKQYKADLVEWMGSRYMVRDVKDFTGYGSGFIEAECTSVENVDDAPEPMVPAMGQLDFSVAGNSGFLGVI